MHGVYVEYGSFYHNLQGLDQTTEEKKERNKRENN